MKQIIYADDFRAQQRTWSSTYPSLLRYGLRRRLFTTLEMASPQPPPTSRLGKMFQRRLERLCVRVLGAYLPSWWGSPVSVDLEQIALGDVYFLGK